MSRSRSLHDLPCYHTGYPAEFIPNIVSRWNKTYIFFLCLLSLFHVRDIREATSMTCCRCQCVSFFSSFFVFVFVIGVLDVYVAVANNALWLRILDGWINEKTTSYLLCSQSGSERVKDTLVLNTNCMMGRGAGYVICDGGLIGHC